MYEYLLGLEFDEVVEALEAHGVDYDFGEQASYEDAKDCLEVYIGGLWSDDHFEVEFDEFDGRWIVSSVEQFEGWD